MYNVVRRRELAGINSWPWQVAVTYTNILTDICLKASTSVIQRRSLIGRNCDTRLANRMSFVPQCRLRSAGLVDLVFFHAVQDSGNEGGRSFHILSLHDKTFEKKHGR